MTRTPPYADLDGLLPHADWLRGLARCLVHDRPDVDDLVQETWVAALRSPPDSGRPARPWLAQVLRNLVRMDARGAGRRRGREEQAAELPAEPAASAEVILERLELQRTIVDLVKQLDEPLRAALLMRFFEGRQPAEIAAAQGIPAGTVRWRISEGLRRLRLRLDETDGDQPRRWRGLLLPLAGPALPDPPARSRGSASSTASGSPAKAIALAAGATALGVAGAVLFLSARTATAPGSFAVDPGGRTSDGTPTPAQPAQEERTMSKNPGTKAAALFGVVLPALVASAQEAKPLPRDEAIAFCVQQREWIVERCKDDYADLMVSRLPEEKRAAARVEWLKKLQDGGTGPLAVRQQKCAAELDKKTQLASISNYADRDAILTCQKEPDCKVALACGHKVIFGKKR